MKLRANRNSNKWDKSQFYKVKQPTRKFICALCEAPREMRYKRNLSPKNYLQIFVLSAFLFWAFFPLMGAKGFFIAFILLPIFEVTNKFLYRKDIPCPYCGFDATWYRRDVKMAKQKVENFWHEHRNEVDVEENQPTPEIIRATEMKHEHEEIPADI